MKMKMLLASLLILIVALPLGNLVIGQTLTSPEDPDNNVIGFVGLGYNDGARLTAGIGLNPNLGIAKSNIWAMTLIDMGRKYGNVTEEAVILFPIGQSRFSVGLVGGVGNDWVDMKNASPMSYIMGSAGLVGTCRFGKSSGGAFWYKFKRPLDKDTDYEPNDTFGAVVWMDL